jgi:hypothetical protein
MHLDDAGWILCRLSENPYKDLFIVEPVGRSPIMVAKLRLPHKFRSMTFSVSKGVDQKVLNLQLVQLCTLAVHLPQ